MTNFQKFQSIPRTPNLNIRTQLKTALRNGVAQSGLSVDEIAIRVNSLIGTTYSGATIYNWTSITHPHLPNPEALVAFCHVSGNYEPLQAMTSPLDIHVIGEQEALLLKIVTSKEAELEEVTKQEKYWAAMEGLRKKYFDITVNEVEQ